MNERTVARAEPNPKRPISPTVWRAWRLFNLYRIVIAGLFVTLGASGRLPPMFLKVDLKVLSWSASLYLLAAIVMQFGIDRRALSFTAARNILVLVDIAALTVFVHASGGAAGGFGILLVVAIAGACLVASTRAGIFFSALATLSILVETVYGSLYLDYSTASYTQAGLLGAVLFVTGILATTLAEQARRSEALAADRAVAIARLSRLNELIVERMRSGIIVLNDQHTPLLRNESARRFLAASSGELAAADSAYLDAAILRARAEWEGAGENRKTPIKLDSGADVIVSFTSLGEGATSGTLVFLEDAAEMQQRAQQIKLASLGRLTASIAHEIRNPLSAITNAGQLMAESTELPPADRRLVQIVVEHAGRVNEVIKNVMMIGRRDSAVSESFAFPAWLEKFVHEVRERFDLREDEVICEKLAADITVRMDKSQLNQVLWNLCENGLRYSQGMPKLRLVCGVHAVSQRPFVDVIDTGRGMSSEIAEQVFEPFFTGEQTGTGLGLYIARELCEANQASLTLQAHGAEGCRFRVLFAHPDRQQLST